MAFLLPQAANIQAFYRMEETSGTRADLSDNANTLQDNNSVLYGTGHIGNAADFELGNDEYLSIADGSQTGLDITGDMTIACWVKLESTPATEMGVVTKDKDSARCYNFAITAGTTKPRFDIFKAGGNHTLITANTSLVAGTWYHICGTYNYIGDGSSELNIYVDGLADATEKTNAVGPIADTVAWFGVGAREYSGYPSYFDGLIDEVIVWNKCLTAAEVLQVKNITKYFAAAGGFSGVSSDCWIFLKDMWEKHNKIWRPNKKILIPQGI